MCAHPRWRSLWAYALLLILPALVVPPAGYSQESNGQVSPADLSTMKIEDLMQLEVTSVSKKEQKVSQVAASIFVITQEDIQHSGANTIPDLLRMVPGVTVAQIDANTWAISVRGFNSEFSNKLLVLIDGRAVYTPTLGGVNWDTVNVPLPDIDRIEVIRGPGGTIWGANAVNGIINIITKKSSDTLGGLISGGGGTQQQAFGTVQYGGNAGRSSTYRVYSQYFNTNQSVNTDGQLPRDDWHLLHGGMRLDTQISATDQLTVEGDVYTGSEGAIIGHAILNPPQTVNVARLADLSGGSIMGRWTHKFSDRLDASVQTSFDKYTRSGPQSYEERHTLDFNFQQHFALSARHDLIWGTEVRTSPDDTVGTIDQSWVPSDRTFNLFSAFLQDEITLKPGRLFLTLGAKLEKTNFASLNVEPAIRLAWTPNPRRTIWGAVSTAYRTPTRRDQNLEAVLGAFPGPVEVLLTGNPDFQSERVIAFEAGYRTQLARHLSLDVSTFLNVYTNLETIGPGTSYVQPGSNPPLAVQPLAFSNETDGLTGGAEVFANWKVNDRWTITPGYAYLKIALNVAPDVTADAQGVDSAHEIILRSHLNLDHNWSWDLNGYYTSNPPNQFVPSNTRVDTQLTWRMGERSQLSFVGQNLLRDHHLEFNDPLQAVNSALVKRGAFARFQWWF